MPVRVLVGRQRLSPLHVRSSSHRRTVLLLFLADNSLWKRGGLLIVVRIFWPHLFLGGGMMRRGNLPRVSYWVVEQMASDDIPTVLRHQGFDV